jgi:Holliday junction resolvasome RuvABC endonuclease subunit
VADIVLGLDLSLTGAGLVAVPSDWSGSWGRIARTTVGHPLKKNASEADRIGRLVRISAEVVTFAEAHRCTAAVLEQYAFTSRHAHAHSLGELGGICKVLLTERCRIPVDVVPPASARKLILGRLPRKDVKAHTRAALTRMGMPPAWTDDEADAFVVANWKLSEIGGYALVVPEVAA